MKTYAKAIVGVFLLLSVAGLVAQEEENKEKREITPTDVIKVFWYKIEKGDPDGALSLFHFSKLTKPLIPRQRATFVMWSKVMKKGETVVVPGPEKVIGAAAAVMVTSREGKTTVRHDVMYLVRKDNIWRILAYGIPGDSPSHRLAEDETAAMRKLKEWARREMVTGRGAG